MSTTIDQRVVEMRFDNKHFENNVATTMSTLDKFKAKLNLSGAAKGLADINTAAKNVDMSSLGRAVDTVGLKFNSLYTIADQALRNITTRVQQTAERMIKSLTVEPIMSGFSEYETKMGSIQTILANTEHQGTKMADVTAALDELNLYADKTIYNFQEMTRNIGTFTAAGVDLDTSVKSIQGIANLAAVSGSTSQQASTAMYQLSQALATGTVKLMDWNSVVNAGMGGKVFQNALIQTAAMLDGSAADVEAWQKKNIDAFGSFRDSLTQGEWLTSEVLTRTLQQFTMAAEVGSETWEEYKKALMDDGYTEAQAESILKMANTATDAATKVKTFTQLMDTLKESAQSGWAQTWETLIGNFEEAKEFFTGLSDLFGGIIGDSANRRNNFLTEVFSSNWNKLISQINAAGVETEKFEASIENLVGKSKLEELIADYGSLEKAVRDGAISSDILKKALDGIAGTGAETTVAGFVEGLKEIESTLKRGDVGEEVEKLQTALHELGYDLGKPGIDGKLGPITEKAIKAFQEANGIIANGVVGPDTLAALEKAGTKVEEVTGNVNDLKGSCDSLIDVITKTSGRELLLNSLMNVIKAIVRPLQAVGEAFRNTFSIAPEKLYNALEKLENFTSKFVMGGLLDITKWNELTGVLETLGISGGEFTKKLQGVLADHGIDVSKLIDKYGSLSNAFNDGAIAIEHIKEALLGFEGITESMLIGGKNADKVRRTFEGLFAILDIIATLTGGALRVGFEIITELLGRFDLNILDVTASIGDSIVAFRDFIDSMLNVSGIVDFLMPYVEKLVQAIGDFIEAIKDSGILLQFAEYLGKVGDGLVRLALAIPGFDSFKNLIKVLKDCGTAFIEWCSALKESENIPGDIISGLVNGLTSGAFKVVSAVIQLGLDIIAGICSALGIHSPSTEMMTVGENVVEGLVIGLQNGVSGLWTAIKDIGFKIVEWFKNIDFGAIFGISVAASMVWLVKKVGDALSILAVPFEGFGSMLEDLGDMFEGIGKKFKAQAWESRANAIRTFAIAVAILAGSVYLLAQIEHDPLFDAVKAIAAIAAVLAVLGIAVGRLGSVNGLKDAFSGIKFSGIAAAMVGLSVALVSISYVVKQLGELTPDQTAQAFDSLKKMLLGLLPVLIICGVISRGEYSKSISKIGGLMIKLSIALLLMVGVTKLIGKLTSDEINGAVYVVEKFLIFIGAVALANRIAGKNVSKLGGTMISLSIALGLMVGVVKLINKLTTDEIANAVDVISKYLLFVAAIAVLSAIPGTSKIGSSLVGVTIALALMVGTVKLIGKLTKDEITKAVDTVGQYLLFVAAIALISMIPGTSRIAGTLLAMSVAIGVLAGVVALMGLLKPEQLENGLTVVTILGSIMALMIWAARGVGKCTGELVVMTVAVGLLAGIVAALSLIEPGKLVAPVIAMTVLMGMFAVIMRSSKSVTGSIGILITITGAVTILGGLVYLLAGLPIANVIGAAGSLSVLLLSITASLKILSTIKGIAAGAFVSMGIMIVIVAALAGILGIMSALDCAPSIETALAISTLLLAMSAVYAVLGLTGGLAGAAITGALGMMGVVAIIGGIALAIGFLMSLIPSEKISEWKTGLEDFMDFIVILTTGIGEAIGGLVGGILDGVASGIETFSGSITKLTDALGPFTAAAKQLDGDTMTGVQSLIDIVTAITAQSFLEKISSFFGGSSMDTFASQLKSFGTAMKDYSTEVTGINVAAITASATAARGLVDVAQAIPEDGFLGLDGIDDFGKNIVTFGKSMKAYAEEVAGINTGAVATSVQAAKDLTAVANAIPDDGKLGTDGIDDFGRNISTFGEKIKLYAEQVTGINIGAISLSITSARMVADFIAGISGLDTSVLSNFKISSLGTAINNYAQKVTDIDTVAVSTSITVATRLKNLVTSLAGMDSSGASAFATALNDLAAVNVGNFVATFQSAGASMNIAGINVMTSFATGIATGQAAVTNQIAVTSNNIVNRFNSIRGSLSSCGITIINSIANGISSNASAASIAASSVIDQMVNSISVKLTMFQATGTEVMGRFISGINSQRARTLNAVASIANAAASRARGYYNSFYNAGKYLVQGFAAGIDENTFLAEARAAAMAAAAYEAAMEELDSNSPSKVFMEVGSYVPMGFAIGIEKGEGEVVNSATSMAANAIDSAKAVVSRLGDILVNEIDAQPTISPVMDLSQIQNGVNQMNGMLSARTVELATSSSVTFNTSSNRMNEAISEIYRASESSNREVVNALSELRGDFGSLVKAINGIHIRMDSGTVVGELIGKIDRGLGQIAMHKGRGI